MVHCLTSSSSDEEAPAQRPAARRRNRPPEVIEIDQSPPASDDSDSEDSARALSVIDCRSASESSDSSDDEAPRRGEYSFSAQPAATRSLSLKTMKQTIKDAGLPTADLIERKDVEERYAQAKARLAEAERLKRRSRDDDGAPAPKSPRVTPPPRPPRPSQPRARRLAQPPHGVGTVPSTGVRVVHNVSGVEGLSIAYDVCDEEVEARIFEGTEACNRRSYDMAFQKSGARRQTDWRLMKNPSKKQDADGNWYGRAASNVRSFRHFAWFDWAAIGFARDHLWAGLALPDEIKYNQYIPCQTRRIPNMLSPHFDPQGHYGEAIVGLSVGADAILVMQRCAKGHSRCDCKAAEKEKIYIPLPRRSMYIFRGRARYSLQPGYTHGLEWPAKRAAPPDWNPTGERRSMTYRAGKAWNLFCLEEPPFPELCRASPAERAQRADALRPLKDRKTKRKGERERWVRPNEESLASLGRHYEKLAWRF